MLVRVKLSGADGPLMLHAKFQDHRLSCSVISSHMAARFS